MCALTTGICCFIFLPPKLKAFYFVLGYSHLTIGEGNGTPPQYSCLENPMDGGAWEEPGRLQSMGSLRVRHDWATSLSLFAFMHWRRKWQPTPVFLPGESQGWEPGGLPSMGSHRVGHDWSDAAAAASNNVVVVSGEQWRDSASIYVYSYFS